MASTDSCARHFAGTAPMLAMAGRPPGRMREGIGLDMRRRLLVCSVVVAVVGLLGALVLYLRAPEARDSDPNDQVVIVDGKAYRIPLASTKMYRRDLRRFGGEGAVLTGRYQSLVRRLVARQKPWASPPPGSPPSYRSGSSFSRDRCPPTRAPMREAGTREVAEVGPGRLLSPPIPLDCLSVHWGGTFKRSSLTIGNGKP